MSDLFMDRSGVYLETVSLGKGLVNWKVHFPTLGKTRKSIEKEYDDLVQACRDLKRFLNKDEVDPETAGLIEQQCPDGEWGIDRD